jgi:DNA-binding PadR family transcriptional regulator
MSDTICLDRFASLAVGLLCYGEYPGRELQILIARYGQLTSLAGFYARMARLEDDGLTEGWSEEERIDDLLVKERWYRVTAAGRRAFAAIEMMGFRIPPASEMLTEREVRVLAAVHGLAWVGWVGVGLAAVAFVAAGVIAVVVRFMR